MDRETPHMETIRHVEIVNDIRILLGIQAHARTKNIRWAHMINLESRLENIEDRFVNIDTYLCKHDFTLAGNWDYKHGYLDRRLDQERMVWLRIPFLVTKGSLDGECGGCHATIKLGRPFVFRHIYNTGTDKHAVPRLMGALFDQFQAPIDPDASVDDMWIEQARKVLDEVETGYLH